MTLRLLGRLRLSFQAFQIADNHAAAIDLDHSLRVQPGEIAGYELAHCANLRSNSWLLTGTVISKPSGVRLPSFWARRKRQEARRWRTTSCSEGLRSTRAHFMVYR
jgi:hypothetical protein